MAHIKYPRTMHIPGSPGATSDDKTLSDLSCFYGKRVIATEKMDGENTTMYSDHIHARSLDSNNHPSRNWVKGLWGSIKHEIPEGWRICGENVYAKHSISYEDLESYFYVFSIWNEKNECLSWEETVAYAGMLGLITVPEIIRLFPFEEKMVVRMVDNLDYEKIEGFVLRNADSFSFDTFSDNVAKWVRKGHVQTDQHWMSGPIVPNGLLGE